MNQQSQSTVNKRTVCKQSNKSSPHEQTINPVQKTSGAETIKL